MSNIVPKEKGHFEIRSANLFRISDFDYDSRCGIDAEYFPGSGSKEMKVLSHDDAELLAALQDLAAMEDLIKPQPLF